MKPLWFANLKRLPVIKMADTSPFIMISDPHRHALQREITGVAIEKAPASLFRIEFKLQKVILQGVDHKRGKRARGRGDGEVGCIRIDLFVTGVIDPLQAWVFLVWGHRLPASRKDLAPE
jgi:hypothetical protein